MIVPRVLYVTIIGSVRVLCTPAKLKDLKLSVLGGIIIVMFLLQNHAKPYVDILMNAKV